MIDLLVLFFTYIPSILIHLVLGLGIVGLIAVFFIGIIPLLNTYKIEIKYISIFLIVLGLYLEGGLTINNDYLAKAKEWENKVQIAETKATEATSKIEVVYQDKIVKEKEIQKVYKDRIIKVSSAIDKDCRIDSEAIKILNDAARDNKVDPITINILNGAAKK